MAQSQQHATTARRLLQRTARTLLACAAAAWLPLAHAAPDVHTYVVSVDESLSALHVEAHFAGAMQSVTARSSRAGRYLQQFDNCDESPRIRMRNRRMIVPAGGIRCMTYTVDLRAAAADQRHNRALADGNVIVSPSAWLWRPEVTDTSVVDVTFRLPEGMQVAVPWQPLDTSGTRYRITKSPESGNAPAAFGHFDAHTITIPGASIQVSLMRGNAPMDNAEILRWVEAAATDVSLAYGQFPNPLPSVMVIPVAGETRNPDSAVPYGRVVRDGGETVELFVNQERPLTEFLDDWTATHEFSHLLLPYVNRQHRWISEGFAQYYQNVLLARSGAYDQERAWQKLYDGFQRGRKSRPELSPNDAAAGGTREGLMKVYWSGAAIALMADVALREQSGGTQTLDSVLRDLQACCLPSQHVWQGPEFFATLDELAGRDIFMPLYRRYANTVGFPDTRDVFAQLGLRVDNDRVRIARSARLGHIRHAITAVDADTATWRQQLAAHAD